MLDWVVHIATTNIRFAHHPWHLYSRFLGHCARERTIEIEYSLLQRQFFLFLFRYRDT